MLHLVKCSHELLKVWSLLNVSLFIYLISLFIMLKINYYEEVNQKFCVYMCLYVHACMCVVHASSFSSQTAALSYKLVHIL